MRRIPAHTVCNALDDALRIDDVTATGLGIGGGKSVAVDDGRNGAALTSARSSPPLIAQLPRRWAEVSRYHDQRYDGFAAFERLRRRQCLPHRTRVASSSRARL